MLMVDDRSVPLDEFEQTVLARLLEAQAEMTGGSDADGKVVPLRDGRRHRRPVTVLAGAAAVAAVTVASVAVATRHDNSASATPALPAPLAVTSGGHAGATAFLERAAALQASSSAGTGSVFFARTQNYSLQTDVGRHLSTTVVSTTIREVWEAANGSATVKEYDQGTYTAGGDIGGPEAVGGIDHTGTYKPGQWADPNNQLPSTTAPAALSALNAEVTHAESSYSSTDAATPNFTIGDIVAGDLETGTAVPDQVAANYQLLATAPGVFLAGDVTDNAGRRGVAVGVMVSDPSLSIVTGTEYFVIDPATGAILEVEEIDSPNPPPALHLPPGPTVEQYSVILQSQRVGTVGTVPTPGS
jgi:hypothetical protein